MLPLKGGMHRLFLALLVAAGCAVEAQDEELVVLAGKSDRLGLPPLVITDAAGERVPNLSVHAVGERLVSLYEGLQLRDTDLPDLQGFSSAIQIACAPSCTDGSCLACDDLAAHELSLRPTFDSGKGDVVEDCLAAALFGAFDIGVMATCGYVAWNITHHPIWTGASVLVCGVVWGLPFSKAVVLKWRDCMSAQ